MLLFLAKGAEDMIDFAKNCLVNASWKRLAMLSVMSLSLPFSPENA